MKPSIGQASVTPSSRPSLSPNSQVSIPIYADLSTKHTPGKRIDATVTTLQTVVQSKDIIVHIISRRARADKLEHFTKVQRIISTDLDRPSDKYDDGIGVR
mmetsp:Transcript_12716/g.18559  ORF Transcript_12716/g.18559 Transcript_12716/m.18559 type:complete len:101 (-) Transcript_12716:340-642(-)